VIAIKQLNRQWLLDPTMRIYHSAIGALLQNIGFHLQVLHQSLKKIEQQAPLDFKTNELKNVPPVLHGFSLNTQYAKSECIPTQQRAAGIL
jgi:hypothetical protein